MKRLVDRAFFGIVLLLLPGVAGIARVDPRPHDTDLQIFSSLMSLRPDKDWRKDVLVIGKKFLGKPYHSKLLDYYGNEQLVVNLRAFDCVTFVENTLALAMTLHSKKPSFEGMKERLRKLRYREGKIDYTDRLHYFSDWLYENERQGLLNNITASLGGVPYDPAFNVMTGKRRLFPQLAVDSIYQKIKEVEVNNRKRVHYFLPKSKLPAVEQDIREGDLVCITATNNNIDIDHVGFAVRINGRLHMLHASQFLKRIYLTKEPLQNYLNRHQHHSGIIVARLNGQIPSQLQ